MRAAAPEAVVAALGSEPAWPPDLAPDDRYVDLLDLVDSGLPERVGRRLGGDARTSLRAGRSAVSMGVASRLWSLTVVPAVRHGLVVDPAALCARDDDGSVVLGVRDARGLTDVTADDLRDVVLAVLAPLVERLPLSPLLHWGNVAASLVAVPRLYQLPESVEVVSWLLQQPPLTGLLAADPRVGVRRRTCCLFYLAPGYGLCGDCALDRVPSRR